MQLVLMSSMNFSHFENISHAWHALDPNWKWNEHLEDYEEF